jgi:hypothetical protein
LPECNAEVPAFHRDWADPLRSFDRDLYMSQFRGDDTSADVR